MFAKIVINFGHVRNDDLTVYIWMTKSNEKKKHN